MFRGKEFKINDSVWYCDRKTELIQVTCPDCLGSGKLGVIMGDGTHVGVDCTCCREEYGAKGAVSRYRWTAQCNTGTITGITITSDSVEYSVGGFCNFRILKDTEVFGTKEEAEIHAEILKAEHKIEDEMRFQKKVKGHKNWAWNAVYHRGQIQDLQKRIEYHQKSLEVAETKAKKPIE